MKRIANLLLAATFVAAMPILALAQTAEEQAEWDKVVEAAKQEGTVTIYSGQMGVPYHPEIARLFTEKYGIKVEILEARASELQERIRTEQTTNRVAGDFSHNGGSSGAFLEASGFYQPHGWMPNLSKLKEEFATNGTQFAIYVQPYGILVNPNLVSEADMPKSWHDLTDPKWKGKILADDFRALGGGSAFFNVTYRKLGREFHEKLAQQNIVFSRQIRDNPRRVARGEFAIYIPLSVPDMLLNEGLPLKAVMPEEGLPFITYDVAVFANAPHPNAAKLLMNFFLEDEAQLVYAKSGRAQTITGADDKVPENIRYLTDVKLMGEPDPSTTTETLKIAKEIYGE